MYSPLFSQSTPLVFHNDASALVQYTIHVLNHSVYTLVAGLLTWCSHESQDWPCTFETLRAIVASVVETNNNHMP